MLRYSGFFSCVYFIVKDVLISSELDKGVRPRTWMPYVNCTLHFSCYGDYLVPEKNHTWSKEYPLSAEGEYRFASDGDEYYLVLSRPHNGKILLAYNCKLFDLVDE